MQYIRPSFVSKDVIKLEAKLRTQNKVLYTAYRPNCYAIYVILSTTDGILVIVHHFVFYAHSWQSTCLS